MPLTVKCGLDLQVRRRRIDARAMKASGRERVQRHVDNVKLSIVRYAALEEEPCLRAAETIFDTPCFAFLVRPLSEGNEGRRDVLASLERARAVTIPLDVLGIKRDIRRQRRAENGDACCNLFVVPMVDGNGARAGQRDPARPRLRGTLPPDRFEEFVYLDASASAVILLIWRRAASTFNAIPFLPYSAEALDGSPVTPLPSNPPPGFRASRRICSGATARSCDVSVIPA